jgi:hypothetical protein
MTEDAARDMKVRLRADMRVAMKEGRPAEVKVIRTLVAAIDNAEAPPILLALEEPVVDPSVYAPTEVERLVLTRAQVRCVILSEVDERERAAVELDGLQPDRAEALRAEAVIAKRYVE